MSFVGNYLLAMSTIHGLNGGHPLHATHNKTLIISLIDPIIPVIIIVPMISHSGLVQGRIPFVVIVTRFVIIVVGLIVHLQGIYYCHLHLHRPTIIF